MSRFILSTDSCCDLFKSELKERNISYINLSLSAEENGEFKIFYDDFHTYDEYVEFYRKMRAGFSPKTTQLTAEDLYEYFKGIRQGDKDILHICLSSGLSGTYNCAPAAAKRIYEDFGVKVYPFDSLAATVGQKRVVLKAQELRDLDFDAERAVDLLEDYTFKLQHWLLITDLTYLKKGGRISGAKAAVGTLLKLRPIITINDIGKLAIYDKAKGTKKGIAEMISILKKMECDFSEPINIVHTDAPELAEELKAAVLDKHPKAKIVTDIMGPVIGAHFGPGSVAFLFKGKERLDIE